MDCLTPSFVSELTALPFADPSSKGLLTLLKACANCCCNYTFFIPPSCPIPVGPQFSSSRIPSQRSHDWGVQTALSSKSQYLQCAGCIQAEALDKGWTMAMAMTMTTGRKESTKVKARPAGKGCVQCTNNAACVLGVRLGNSCKVLRT